MQDNVTAEIENLVQDMLRNVHTCIPGKIDSFDSGNCLAVVVPTGQFITPSGEKLDYPKIHDVPVVIQQCAGQDVTMAFPIKDGDGCMIHFAEQQLDQFRDDEEAKCDLRFDLTNAIAVVGLFSQANDLMQEACDNDAVIIDNKKKGRVTIKEDELECKVEDDSTFTIKNDQQECKVGGATLTIKSDEITAEVATFKIKGKLEVSQTIDADGGITSKADVKSANRSLSLHEHICTAPGSPTIPIPRA